MTSYAELLRDPRWQRKRLEVMDRAKFACAECSSTTRTLNVHHRYYEKGRAPWEYPHHALVCLCEVCHARAEGELAGIRMLAGRASRAARWNILGYAMAASLNDERWAEDLASNPSVVAGAAAYFRLSVTDVEALRSTGPLSSMRLWERACELEFERDVARQAEGVEDEIDALAQFYESSV